MNKNELIAEYSSKNSVGKTDATKAVDTLIEIITDTLKSGGDVKIAGFGTFKVADTKAKTGRNPRTGESIQIAASKKPKFLAGKQLKELIKSTV
jgi:DNA-binding protein HU-beta